MTFEIMGRSFHFLSDESQWSKLYFYFRYFLLYKSAVLGLVLIVSGLLIAILGSKAIGIKQKAIRWICFMVYTVGLLLLFITFHDHNGYGIKPFKWNYFVTEDGFHESRVLICMAYVMIFAPAGYFLAPLLGKHWYLAIPACLLLAELIEFLQYALETGFSGQWDAISYFVGMTLGLLVGRLRYRWKSRRKKQA